MEEIPTWLLYFLSSIAQCAAAFAALVAVFSVFRLQANSSAEKDMRAEIKAWLVEAREMVSHDYDGTDALLKNLNNIDPKQPYKGDACEYYKKLTALNIYPSKLNYKVSVPLKYWAILFGVSILLLPFFSISFCQKTSLYWFFVGLLTLLSAKCLWDTREFIQECLDPTPVGKGKKTMNIKIKKVIAREGLFIIGFIVVGFLLAFVSDYLWQHSKTYIQLMTPTGYSYDPLSLNLFWNRVLSLFSFYKFPSVMYASSDPYHRIWFLLWMEHLGEFIFLYGYLVCLPFRFIIWSIKTLKEKK